MSSQRFPGNRWSAREVSVEVAQTLLRMFRFPARTGLQRIGNPDRHAPVLLTCNFQLTVQRVRRALAGCDAWLLVANSRGVNVWCAATGGLFTDHDVVSVLKTSRVGEKVDHRRVILPQLAATGIDAKVIRQRAGWQVVWGPVEAAAIPKFLRSEMERTIEPIGSQAQAMRTVAFPLARRLEMAVAWAFPLSVLTAAVLLPFRPAAALPAIGLVWGLALGVYGAFPLYRRWLRATTRRSIAGLTLDLGQLALAIAFWVVLMVGWVAADLLLRRASPLSHLLPWGAGSLLVLVVLGVDLSGSTPVYKSGLQADRLLTIALDESRCSGAAFCAGVCPKGVFAIDHARRLAVLDRPDECVQCGACIVQCPFDALFFAAPDGTIVPPQTIREFKLNLLGTRERARDPRPGTVGRDRQGGLG